MKLTIDVADEIIVQIVARHPECSVIDTVQNLMRSAIVGESKPATLRNIRYKKNDVAHKMAHELLTHVLKELPAAKTFRALDVADKYFGDRLAKDDRGLRSSLGIHFGRVCDAHRKEAASGTKVIVPDTNLARGACFYVTLIG